MNREVTVDDAAPGALPPAPASPRFPEWFGGRASAARAGAPDRRRRTDRARAYGVALGATVLVVLARWLAEPVLGGALPLVTLFAGVAVAVWVGGRGPALLTAVLGYVACEYVFVVPREGADAIRFIAGFAVALATCGIIIASGEAMRAAQATARAKSALLRTALGSITDGVIVTGPDGRVVYVNPVAEALTGWMRDEAVGRPLEHVFRMIDESTGGAVELPAGDTDWLPAAATVDRAVLVGRDGITRPLEARAATLRDPYDAAVGSVVVFRDVGEQRRAERALACSERNLRDFFDNASVGLHWVGPDGIVLRVNQAELDLLGYTRDEYVGRPMASFHVDPRDALDILARLHAGETLRDRPARLRAKDGTTKEVLIDCNVLRDGDRFVHTRCITRDVTAQRRAEAALRDSEARTGRWRNRLPTPGAGRTSSSRRSCTSCATRSRRCRTPSRR